MPVTHDIAFIARADGRIEPTVLHVVDAPANYTNLGALVRHAQRLPRPPGAQGLQIRDGAGAIRYTMQF